MARVKWSGYIDPDLIDLVKERANTLERSEAFIVETGLRKMFDKDLPDGWKPGASDDN